jgi:formate dehydrogenase subunit gamma
MSDPRLIEPGDEIRPGEPPRVNRYRLQTRINHWANALCMVLLVVSGLSMFHPSMFFLTAIFGGGQNTRAIHPWIGVVLVVSFLLLFLQFWRGNLWNRTDLAWLAHIGDLLRGREEKMPEIGKYNAGQKFVFWCMALLILGMLATGVVIWDRYFSGLTPIPTQRLALWAHSIGAICVICVLVLHIYAAIWVRGSFGAMIKGWVSVGWAWRHHRQWLRRLAERLPRRGGGTILPG